MGASAVCRPGPEEPESVATAPAVSVAVLPATPVAPTTVTAVTTDWLPLGSVLVFKIVLVLEDTTRDVELPDGVVVRAPPPTVETTTTPTLLVEVMTWPSVKEVEEVSTAAVVDGEPSADVNVEVGEESAPPLEEAVVSGEATAEVAKLSELPVVLVEDPSGTGVPLVVVEESTAAGVVVVVVPLLTSWRLLIFLFTSSPIFRLAKFTMLVASDGSSLWMASTAVRSSGNMPCLNFFGEKSWRAAWSDGGST